MSAGASSALPERAAILGVLRSVLRDLGSAPPLDLNDLSGGSSQSFLVDLEDGQKLVLKTYGDGGHLAPRKEAYASGLLSGLDVPVTRYLTIDESRTRLPFRFAITNYLPGVTVGSLADEPEVTGLYRAMGALLRRLHSVSMPAFGRFGEDGVAERFESNALYMRALAEHAFSQFRRYGGEERLASRLEDVIADGFAVFEFSAGPVFAHDDLHPNNVLAARDPHGRLRISGLIDLGNARASDAVCDLAKTLFCCEHDAPGSTAHILAGYGPIPHPDPTKALWLYTLLHRVVMWWWLRHVGVIPDGERHDLITALAEMAHRGPVTPIDS